MRFLNRRLLALVAIVALTVAFPRAEMPQASAPPVDAKQFQGMSYRLIGPSRGGRVTAVTGVPSQPTTFYMGVASGGVFKTSNNGASWTPITDGKVPLGSIGAIAVADSDPNVVYVGTGSDGVRSNVSTGRGMYKSTDGGTTWTFAGLYNAGQIGSVRIHPTNSDIVWVAAVGDIFKPNNERGVFKTVDGGSTWKKVLYLSDQVGSMDVEVQPGNPNIVYAWMSRLERKPWTIISGGPVGGFYKSTDAGETFTKISTGLPTGLVGKGNLAVTAANPNRVYALIEALPGGGFYRSDDAGATWKLINPQGSLLQRPFYYTTLGADPTNADVVYAGAEGFFKSTDAGVTFTSMRTPHGDNHDIWVNPKNGQIMVQANDGGANVSTDGGRTWSPQNNQVTSEIYGVWMDNEFPYQVYGAQQDNSTLILSSQRGAFDTDWLSGPGCETGPIIPHPSSSDIVYGSCKGQYGVMNMKTRQEKQYWIGGQSLYGNAGRDLIYRFQRVSPMALSPHDPKVLYYGSQFVHRTRDLGVTWEKISPDLTAFPACCQGASGEPITRDVTGEEFYSALYAIIESPLEAGVIWTGANDGPFHVTRDNGKTWKNITPKDLPTGGRVAWIDASAHRKGSAYFAVYRYLLGDYQPYIYRTDDYGATWTKLTDGKNGIPADSPTRVVREDPGRAGLLYAGTEFGMFISFDNGARWQPFQLNLPNVPINDIKVHNGDLVVATQGRSIWIFDNLSAVRQLAAAAPATPRLYTPRPGYRTRESPEILGPTVEYYLPAAATAPVTIEILDAKGQLVNSYSSETPAGGRGGRGGRGGGGQAASTDPDAPMLEGRSAPATSIVMGRVTKTAGHNRFVWDVRNQAGLPLPPGTYQVRLKVGTETLTAPLTVKIDPRIAAEGMTVADLQEQFDHNTRMAALVTSVNQTVTRVRALQAQLKAGTPADQAKLSVVDEIANQLNTQPVRYGKPGLQAHIQYLSRMTTGVDQKVGRDALERYAVLKKELDAIIAQLDRLVK